MATKKKTLPRGVPTPTELKRLERAHIKAEDKLRHAEAKVMAAKRTAKRR